MPRLIKSHKTQKTITFYLFIAPWLLGFIALILLPLIAGFGLSLTNYDGININNLKFKGIDNYTLFFGDEDALYSLSRVLLWTALNTPLWLVLSFVLAYILNHVLRARGLFRTLFYIPSVIPIVTVAWIARLILVQNTGFLNQIINVFIPGTAIRFLGTWSMFSTTVDCRVDGFGFRYHHLSDWSIGDSYPFGGSGDHRRRGQVGTLPSYYDPTDDAHHLLSACSVDRGGAPVFLAADLTFAQHQQHRNAGCCPPSQCLSLYESCGLGDLWPLPLCLRFGPHLDSGHRDHHFLSHPVPYVKSLGPLRNGCIFATLTVLTSSMAGYAFARIPAFGRTRLFAVVASLIMVPTSIYVIPQFVLFARLKFFIQIFANYWAYTPWVLWALAASPLFHIFLFHQFFSAFPQELEEAAEVDGAGILRTFFQIVVPNALPVIATSFILNFLIVWGG